jgi:uncharacterized protein YcgI (DUF1989 family)
VLTYSVEQLSSFDAAFYNAARAELSNIAELTVLPREAKAFEVPAGHLFRIVSIEGPQVGDLNLWNAHDLTERFYSGKTRALHATHLSTGDRLWSTFPSLRPMATIARLVWVGRRWRWGARCHRHTMRPLHQPVINGDGVPPLLSLEFDSRPGHGAESTTRGS